MKFNVPNIISLLRVIIAPIFFILLVSENRSAENIACILFFLGAISDYIDGWLARKYGEVSSWGKFFDPLADKILTTSAFAAFVVVKILPLWMILIIIVRDFGTTILRAYAEKRQKPINTSLSAKLKTTLQMFFISVILLLIMIKNQGWFSLSEEKTHFIIYSPFIYYSMLFLTLFTVWTALEYVYQNRILFKMIWDKSA